MKRKSRGVSAAYRKAVAAANKGKHEGPFLLLWRQTGLPMPERDYRFVDGRKFALDFAWPHIRIGVELHGGGGRSRHTTVKGHASDCEKLNLAARGGWWVLQFNVIRLRNLPGVVDEVAELVRREMAA